MNALDVEEILKTFRIVVDTREQATPKANHRYKSFGVPYERGTLRYGDYSANITVNDVPLYSVDSPIFSKCIVERKMSLDELAICFTSGRDRFEREFRRAQENGARIYMIVENGSYEKIQRHDYKSRFHPNAFLASLAAWVVRYNINLTFCQSMTSGMLIKEFLYRDIKERLEKGDFDGES